jgi:hypothetical protein
MFYAKELLRAYLEFNLMRRFPYFVLSIEETRNKHATGKENSGYENGASRKLTDKKKTCPNTRIAFVEQIKSPIKE